MMNTDLCPEAKVTTLSIQNVNNISELGSDGLCKAPAQLTGGHYQELKVAGFTGWCCCCTVGKWLFSIKIIEEKFHELKLQVRNLCTLMMMEKN